MPSARLGHRNDTLAVADEHIDPEFLLQQPDLLADPRLRGEKRLGASDTLSPWRATSRR